MKQLLIVILFLFFVYFTNGNHTHIHLGVILNDVVFDLDYVHFKPSIDIAFDEIKRRVDNGEYLNFTTSYVFKITDNTCGRPTMDAPGYAADFYYDENVAGFFGPLCSGETAPVADLCSHWNIPIVSGVSTSGALDDKSRYRTLTRTSFKASNLVDFMVTIFRRYNWKRCSIIWDSNQAYWRTVLTPSLINILGQDGVTLRDFEMNSFGRDIKAIMEAAVEKARIILLVVIGPIVRQLMLQGYDMGLINGEYAFFSFYPFNNRFIFGDDNWKQNDDRDEDAKYAYQALMNFQLYEPDTAQFRAFKQEYTLRQVRDYNFSRPPGDDFGYLSAAMYDAVILYSLAVNQTLAENGDVRDGMAMTRKMWNRTFEGVYGTIKVNDNGDRDGDYSMWDMVDTENGVFKMNDKKSKAMICNMTPSPLHIFDGSDLEIYDDFKYPGTWICSSEKDFNIRKAQAWVDSLLEYEQDLKSSLPRNLKLELYTIKVKSVLMKMRLDAEALNMSWKIRYDDLVFLDASKSIGSMSKQSLSLAASGNTEGRPEQIFAKLANLEGRVVVVKNLTISKVDLSKNVLKELRNMRAVEHANITRFIGACVDPPNVCVIIEYCQKGSLQDVLQNESFKLDASFKQSLMIDMAKGLHYLHGSVLGLHGRLSSSNCTIDSRFVLKLTDFGLHEFQKSAKQEDTTTCNNDKLLWRAPEVLRNPLMDPTKESDIYSAGMVIYAIVTRDELFDDERLDIGTDAILEKLKSGGESVFRPRMEVDNESKDMYPIVQQCWSEKPDDRPHAKALLTGLRKLNKGSNSENILDNLLTRMEQYANNLETLVEDRTAALVEEKKRSETLLYEVLPKSVADQLKHGNSVDPESFESVTIFFSDIVGFTSLSAASTPLQVVALLNDLYTCFDSTIDKFDVYKVETIGDAYMVVSGLPLRNGALHAREIGGMSLALLQAVDSFKIRHVPDKRLQLRAGVHTGPCVAGVVGLKMPRYCLFGDTVNTASRMESNGEALKIHISSSTKKILDTFETFETVLRGEVEMKGKGTQTTYWLINNSTEGRESTA
ncbi:atrial natriuretic peptide receptor 1-like [Amphiura filiformis]|uniref:atrial natriuretic peptide receptor 1-like n=1 Tax=Amphiura filiformis TaxID=82378 RepID=UPI003B213F1B